MRKPGNKFYLTAEFKQLHDVWMNKLKQEKFPDIERNVWGGSVRYDIAREKPAAKYMLRQEADTLRHQFLYEYEFKNEEDRDLWEVYTENGGQVPRDKYPLSAIQVYTRMRPLKQAFREWFLQACQDESTVVDYNREEILRELEELSAKRAVEGYAAQKPKYEVYDEHSRRWKRTHGGDGV